MDRFWVRVRFLGGFGKWVSVRLREKGFELREMGLRVAGAFLNTHRISGYKDVISGYHVSGFALCCQISGYRYVVSGYLS